MNSIQDPLDFDDLSAVYRVERKAPTLSNVRKDLYPAMASLLTTLKSEYDRHLSLDPESLICEGANQRKKRANQLSKEIVELRMGKICSLALRGAMGAQNSVDSMTPEEKGYYTAILEISKKQEDILNLLMIRKKPSTRDIDLHVPETKVPEPVPEEIPMEDAVVEGELPIEAEIPEPYVPDEEFDGSDEAGAPEEAMASEEIGKEDMVVIRILEDLPTFSGPEQDYKLFKEDIVRMPTMMADALIGRNKAVQITPTP